MVSVVMATYNGEKYIVKQLETIRRQTRMPDEVIICDDGSTDNTKEIVLDYIKQKALENWSFYSNSSNMGFYDNFFKAVFLAKGDTIYLSDQDDMWDTDKINIFEKIYQKKSDCMMLQSNYIYIDKKDKPIERKVDYHGKGNASGYVPLSIHDICKFAGSGFTMSSRKEVVDMIIENALQENKDMFEFHDVLFGLMAVTIGKCGYVPEVIDRHRLHDKNVTQQARAVYVSDRTRKAQIDILEKRIQRFNLLINLCNNTKKTKVFKEYSDFAAIRKNYIERFNLKDFIKLMKYKDYYASKLGLVTDTMYSAGMEKILLYLYKKI